MTVLEFIRKNSLLVLIVIAAVGLGLVMMDYSGKGSYFSRDFYIQVNGTGYSYPETAALGENGQQYVQSLYSATTSKLRNKFDKNEDDALSADEQASMNAWLTEHPEYQEFTAFLSSVLQAWSYGYAGDAGVNAAINRAILHEEAAALGIYPSKEQLDSYISNMPAFRQEDGSFDQALYQRLTGYHNGMSNNAQEAAFRKVVADMMVWECLSNMLTEGVRYQTKSLSDLMDMFSQKVSGLTAWLPAGAVSAPAEPTEEELKAYWEQHREQYKTEERRIVSLYTLTPAEGATLEGLMSTADALMQDLSAANGKGFDNLLASAAENPENEAFTYLNAEGKSHETYPLSTLAKAAAALQQQVEHNGNTTTLAHIAYNEVEGAPAPAEYEQAAAQGKADDLASITQVRGYFPTKDGKLVFIRVEAAEAPAELEFDAAREAALADLKKERADNALDIAAKELFSRMEAAENAEAAFALAVEAGASKESFGPVSVGLAEADLPAGLEPKALISVPTGKMAPLVVNAEGARFTAVTKRTLEESAEYNMMKAFSLIPSQNAQLSTSLLLDWLHHAYTRYNVQLSEHIKLNK